VVDATEDPRYFQGQGQGQGQGVEQFRRGNYFRSHEVWEELWKEAADSDRQFFRGLIQAAVALHHAGRGNAPGALKLLGTAEEHLAAFLTPARGARRGSVSRLGSPTRALPK
jgi:predicted metal-dependent hydrolase